MSADESAHEYKKMYEEAKVRSLELRALFTAGTDQLFKTISDQSTPANITDARMEIVTLRTSYAKYRFELAERLLTQGIVDQDTKGSPSSPEDLAALP